MIPNFKFWCQKVLPSVYDDSLSYYELLCKVVDYLNKTIDQSNATAKEMEELKSYVDNYFKNLDVTEEINNKLDDMAADGTLDKIINENIFNELNEDIKNIDAKVTQVGEKVDADIAQIRKEMPNAEYSGLVFKPIGCVAIKEPIIAAAKAGGYIIGFDADNFFLISNVDYNTVLTKVEINKAIVPHVNDAAEYDDTSILCACGLTGKVAKISAPSLNVSIVDVPACSDMDIYQLSRADDGYFVCSGIGPSDIECAFVSHDLETLYSRKKYNNFANTIVYPGTDVYGASQGTFARGNCFYSMLAELSGGRVTGNGYCALIFNKNSELVGSMPSFYTGRGEVEGCYDDGQCIHVYVNTTEDKSIMIKASPSVESMDRYYVNIDPSANANTYTTSKYIRTAFVAANVFTNYVEANIMGDITEDAAYYSILRSMLFIKGNGHSLNLTGESATSYGALIHIENATIVNFFRDWYMYGTRLQFTSCTLKGTNAPCIRVQDGVTTITACQVEYADNDGTAVFYGGLCTVRNSSMIGSGTHKIQVDNCVHNTSDCFE